MNHILPLNEQEKQTITKILRNWSNKSKTKMTLDGLIKEWANFVSDVEHCYDDSIYEYTNDLSVRDILKDILDTVQESARIKIEEILKPLDARFNESTIEIKRALVPIIQQNASSWWFRIPKKLSKELEDDLRSEGLI